VQPLILFAGAASMQRPVRILLPSPARTIIPTGVLRDDLRDDLQNMKPSCNICGLSHYRQPFRTLERRQLVVPLFLESRPFFKDPESFKGCWIFVGRPALWLRPGGICCTPPARNARNTNYKTSSFPIAQFFCCHSQLISSHNRSKQTFLQLYITQ
jgi:hypothetical protein